jgi:nitrogen regulatory protein PII
MLFPKSTIEIEEALADRTVPTVVDAIVKTARSCMIGDGKVCVCSIENANQIQAEEPGDAAV